MYITILGRQPALGMAELEHLYGADNTRWFSDQSALVETDSFSIERLGGTQKAGRVTLELDRSDWQRASTKIIHAYSRSWADFGGKITLGISAYGFDVSPRDVQKTGIVLKQRLKKAGVSLRLIPNIDAYLNTATSHHNKLGLSNNKFELLIIRARDGHVIVAESTGSQNITALARRDQGRPKRDAFVGMLPPKLAQIMINLAVPAHPASSRSHTRITDTLETKSKLTSGPNSDLARSSVSDLGMGEGEQNSHQPSLRILDPFCGTGVILQEAALMGYDVYGTDLSDKMVDYARTNLQWLASSHHIRVAATIEQGDAIDTKWQPPIDAVVCESYLGQPFSAPPSPAKLDQVRKNCDHIITKFLQNLSSQITNGTSVCVAVPAWRNPAGQFTHLPFITQLTTLGYEEYSFTHVKKSDLLYYREDQVVARELLVLVKS
jgi:tRNA G10  N-methylase Trm11